MLGLGNATIYTKIPMVERDLFKLDIGVLVKLLDQPVEIFDALVVDNKKEMIKDYLKVGPVDIISMSDEDDDEDVVNVIRISSEEELDFYEDDEIYGFNVMLSDLLKSDMFKEEIPDLTVIAYIRANYEMSGIGLHHGDFVVLTELGDVPVLNLEYSVFCDDVG